MEEDLEIQIEKQVLKNELNQILTDEVPLTFKSIIQYIESILNYACKPENTESENKLQKNERLNLTASHGGLDGIKCSLIMVANELKNIEINYKPSVRHNNYIYKSKDECSWNLYQISNSADILKSLISYIETIPVQSLHQTMMNVDYLIENLNSARNVIMFPKKRHISELQNQKNMKIFPLVPNDLVFSFYIQGYRLILAIYILKGNESTKHILECNSIPWLNNVMILLTVCLNKLQQLKDKLSIFEQANLN